VYNSFGDSMIINELKPQGFCHGVAKALKIVKDTIKDKNVKKPIYILGLIVHNKKIKEALDHYGVISFDNPNMTRLEMAKKINDGTVILSAHGTSLAVKKMLEAKNIQVIDATCSDVYKVHTQILKNKDDYEIVYIGKKNHPEVEAVLSLTNDITLVSSISDARKLKKRTKKPLYITNQTTLSLFEVLTIVQELKKKHQLIFNSDICMATTKRQGAVIEQPKADLLIVVGDTYSSNTNKLKEVSERDAKIKSYRVESISDIDPEWFKDVKIVNVTSGASTSKAITSEVINYLKQFNYNDKSTWDNTSKVSYEEILS
jgi:4-hydroxy-3-methylbut-2-enyl diphosphate reductase